MDFNYSYKLPKDKILVALSCDHSLLDSIYPNLVSHFYNTGQQYGFSCTEGLEGYSKGPKYALKHAIIISSLADPVALTEKYLPYLSSFNKISLGIIYNSEQDMLQAKYSVDRLKRIHGDKINYLRPDVVNEQGHCWISEGKILDNAICDTVRVKYNPKQISNSLEDFDDEHRNFFFGVADLYTRYCLYHRSPHDGFIASRGNDGFYITATKTDKSQLSLDRISFVHDYNEKSNELTYSGQYLPSSDVVEAFVLFRDNPQVQSIVHLHASDQFTRNPDYAHKIKVGISSYGVASLGYKIHPHIKSNLDDFLIVKEHGEVFPLTQKGMAGVVVFENALKRYLPAREERPSLAQQCFAEEAVTD